MVARLHRGERVERSSRTVGEVAEAWLERGRGQKGPWDATTRQRYARVVRQQVLGSADSTRRPLGETKLRDVTADRIAAWSQGNEEALAPSTARIGEALGVRWCDVDVEADVLRVRQQLSRHRAPKHLKTDAARREVVLAPAVTRLLRERWLASSYKGAQQLVFCKATGEGGDYPDAGKAFRAAVKAAGLHGQGRLSLHSLRHAFASLLIAKGLNVVFVSRELGHASPAITLEVYAHLFEQADHATAAREALEANYQTMVNTMGR
jgi:integrase